VLAGAAAAGYRSADRPAVSPEIAAPSRQAASSPRVILPSPFRQATATAAAAPGAKWPPASGAVEHNEAMVALLTLASTPKAAREQAAANVAAANEAPANDAAASDTQASTARQNAPQADARPQARNRTRRAPQAGNDTIVVRDVRGRRIRIKRANIPQISGYRARIYASSPYRGYGPPAGR
jgi:hypothetical protein